MARAWKLLAMAALTCGLCVGTGCSGKNVMIPSGFLPMQPTSQQTDRQASESIQSQTPAFSNNPTKDREAFAQDQANQPAVKEPKNNGEPFTLPAGLPGVKDAALTIPKFNPATPLTEREKELKAVFPELRPVSTEQLASGPPIGLRELQQIASQNSPVIRRALADVDVAYGAVIQAGLYPNPTAGWQADQWMPGNKPSNNSGQQGAYINQLIKTMGKVPLARAVAGFDYLNALVAVRRAEVDVFTQVRTHYFAALLAQRTVEISRLLAQIADDVYQMQLRQVAAGEAAGYEPLQLYVQAVDARNALTRAEANYHAAWRQLAASLGQPDFPTRPLEGSIENELPELPVDTLRSRMLEVHTDLLTTRNKILRAQTDLRLQQVTPVPDLQTNFVLQDDNSSGNRQFNIQLGIEIPVFNRNQGNIRSAQAMIRQATQDLQAQQFQLISLYAEAVARYEANRKIVENYRERILPNLTRAYRGIVRRYQIEPDKVSFNDIVVAQQNLGQGLNNYLSALDLQWKATVDLANLSQLDDLVPMPPAAKE